MLAFYSEGSSSNPSEDYKSKSCCKQMKINNDADLAHFETFGYVFVIQSDGCGFESHNPRSLWSRLNISRVDISVERTKNVLERRKLFSNIFSSWTTTKKFLEAPRERERERWRCSVTKWDRKLSLRWHRQDKNRTWMDEDVGFKVRVKRGNNTIGRFRKWPKRWKKLHGMNF